MKNKTVQKNKRQYCKKKTTQISKNSIVIVKKINDINIDYDRLAESLLKAENKKQEKDKQKEKIELEKNQEEWEKALKVRKYESKNLFQKVINFFKTLRDFWIGVVTFDKKYANNEFGIYGFMKLFCSLSMIIYETVFFLFSLFFLYKAISPIITLIRTIKFNNALMVLDISQLNGSFLSGFLLGIILFFFFMLIARLLRILRLKLDNCINKNTINAVVCFVTAVDTIAISICMEFISNVLTIVLQNK